MSPKSAYLSERAQHVFGASPGGSFCVSLLVQQLWIGDPVVEAFLRSHFYSCLVVVIFLVPLVIGLHVTTLTVNWLDRLTNIRANDLPPQLGVRNNPVAIISEPCIVQFCLLPESRHDKSKKSHFS
jgi:hypothetical protein